jgi:hypothetical protein
MSSKRSLWISGLSLVFAVRAIYLISRLGAYYGYKQSLITCVLVGLVVGHFLFQLALKLWHLPWRSRIVWGVPAAIVFFGIVPQIFFALWPQVGRAYSLGIATTAFIELAIHEFRKPRETLTADSPQG